MMKSNVNKFQESSMSNTCCICLNGKCDCSLPCSHEFHNGCLVGWLEKGEPNCPLCKR